MRACARSLGLARRNLKDLKGVSHDVAYFLLIISIGRLEATADADGDVGRSSQLDHSKELDLYFPELYWSSFLGSVQKNPLQKQNGLSEKKYVYMFSHGKRISARKSALHRKVATNDRYSFFYGEE